MAVRSFLLGTKGAGLLVESPTSTLEFPSMIIGNGVRDSQQLRDIEDLVARLQDINRQLALPLQAIPATAQEAEPADAPNA